MLRNYLKVASRNLKNNKLYSSINILGLAIGLGVSMLILLYVLHELSYDHFHTNGDRIHKVRMKVFFGEQEISTTVLSAGFAQIVSERLPEVEDAVRVCPKEQIVFKSDDRHIFSENQLLFADANILDVFSFNLLEGNATTVLNEPQTLVLTKPIAKKYFGAQNPIGKTLIYEGELPFTVTGIIEEPPSNSTIKFDLIASLNSLNAIERLEAEESGEVLLSLGDQKMGLGRFETYLLLSPEAGASEVVEKIAALQAEEEGFNLKVEHFMDALPNLHLGKQATNRVYLFLGIALLVLSLALINYISLSTARAIQRSKEVAIRKIIGATRRKLIIQFYTESILLTGLSFLIGIGLILLFQPLFYDLLELKIDRQFIYHPSLILLYGGLLLIVILISGSLPALLMSAYRPVSVLKSRIKSGKGGNQLRQGFTIFQFTAAAALMICSFIVYQQLQHYKFSAPEYTKKQILCIPFEDNLKGKLQAYQNELTSQIGIEKLATSSMSIFRRGVNIFFVTSPFNQKEIALQAMNVNSAFLDLFQLKWSEEPKDFNRIGADNTLILNEQAKREFGQEEIIGEGVPLGGELSKEVIGIVEDFHYQSLEAEIPPLAIQIVEEPAFFEYFGGAFYIEFTSNQNLSVKLQQLETIHEKFSPDQPFQYYFLDEAFDGYYRKEVQLGKMLGIFTGFAIFIACLGLFGLITYTTQQRSKEVGIRKVLGASILSIVKLFSIDFIKLVLISLIIASVIAWYLMNQWLQNFNYRTDIHWWVFAFSGFLVLAIALLTVGFQSIKTALMNPVKSLRNE